MRVLIFGGAGFLGGHVADAFSEKGDDVAIYDIHPFSARRPDQEMIVGDILDEKAVEAAVRDRDYVYNFAGIADIDEAHTRPVDTVRTNVVGNAIILEACRKHKVKRFVFASSVYVYSRSGSFYRNSKEACELITESYREIYGLPYTILRYGSLYGPRADNHNWIQRILTQALSEGKITRRGDGEEIREYIHVQDAARCSVDILTPDYENQNVVITGHQPMRIKDLLIMIKEILGNEIEIEYVPAQADDLHYNITPYSFNPRIGKKLVSSHYLDMGQGILNCLAETHNRLSEAEEREGVLVEDD